MYSRELGSWGELEWVMWGGLFQQYVVMQCHALASAGEWKVWAPD
jgi:hypothetical protein